MASPNASSTSVTEPSLPRSVTIRSMTRAAHMTTASLSSPASDGSTRRATSARHARPRATADRPSASAPPPSEASACERFGGGTCKSAKVLADPVMSSRSGDSPRWPAVATAPTTESGGS